MKVRQGKEVTIAKEEVIDDDLYVFAKVTVNGTIKGDLIVFAQQININGSVEGDLIAAGQQVLVNGKVSDDVRIAEQALTLQDVGDDSFGSWKTSGVKTPYKSTSNLTEKK